MEFQPPRTLLGIGFRTIWPLAERHRLDDRDLGDRQSAGCCNPARIHPSPSAYFPVPITAISLGRGECPSMDRTFGELGEILGGLVDLVSK
jgi:hypothetical protein